MGSRRRLARLHPEVAARILAEPLVWLRSSQRVYPAPWAREVAHASLDGLRCLLTPLQACRLEALARSLRWPGAVFVDVELQEAA